MNTALHDINSDGVLAIPALLWAIILFEARGWVLAFFAFVSTLIGPQGASNLATAQTWQLTLIPEILALLVLWAALRRTPIGGPAARWIWRHGPVLISLAAISHGGWAIWRHHLASNWLAWHDDSALLLAIPDILIAIGVWLSPHARAVFQEFPAHQDPGAPKQ